MNKKKSVDFFFLFQKSFNFANKFMSSTPELDQPSRKTILKVSAKSPLPILLFFQIYNTMWCFEATQ